MKNLNKVNKIIAVILVLSMALALCACGSKSSKKNADYNIAIVKQMDHESLDQIADSIANKLDEIADENNITIDYTIYSGQGDQSTLKQIGDQVVSEGVDAIIPIATMAAQVMTSCAEGKNIPVIYGAISNPEDADLTGIDYVTGTSDGLDTTKLLDMMFAANPDIKSVGLLYSLSEVNSATPVKEAKEYLDKKGIKYVEATGNTNDEIISAVSTLVSKKVDAVFTPTDNIVMAVELTIAETLAGAHIPHYAGADSFVTSGALATCGCNYIELGAKTAELAYQAITKGMDSLDDYYTMDGNIITVNTDTAASLGIDENVFKSFGEVKEVTTTAE